MKLSALHTGERGVIVKVYGHGGFRKRIVEMGFVRGKTVKVVLNAPLHDPIEYELLGYKISLRRAEADLVEVISESEAKALDRARPKEELRAIELSDNERAEMQAGLEARMAEMANRQRRELTVALVGNPNCGKTSLFNVASGAHEHVGNYSGVTVDAKEGHFTFQSRQTGQNYHIRLVDLPGTYSLSAYSPEELYVRRQLIDHTPDVVLNVIDSSNLERNLYLTTQLLDMNLRMVVALNMYDDLEKNGDRLDFQALGTLLGVPMVPTVSRSGRGIDELFEIIVQVYETNNPSLARHIHVNHGKCLEHSIDRLKAAFQKNQDIRYKYSTRYLAIKLLEGDSECHRFIDSLPNHDELIAIRYDEQQRIRQELGDSAEAALVDAKYGFIQGALRETFEPQRRKRRTESLAEKIDALVTNRWLGFPLFFVLLYLIFEGTFVLGDYPMQGIDWIVARFADFVALNMEEGMLKDLVTDGIIGGVGSVIVFLPNILILYLFISLLEDSGYMARAAFIMDKLMHKLGLHGKSFIPMIMGFGCNVPAVMATRTIENPKSRLVTMLVTPLMSCSARLPVYLILTGAFFRSQASLVLLGLYSVGILFAVLAARLFSRYLVKGEDLPFVMELPPYRVPTIRSVVRHTWEKGRQYLQKMGGIILAFSIVIWALGYFPADNGAQSGHSSADRPATESYLQAIGHAVAPAFAPMGFDWKMTVGIFSGVGAKELVVSTLGVMYAENYDEADDTSDTRLQKALRRHTTPASALAYMVFVLLYFPCIATIVAIKNESGRWRWALFAASYTTALAYVASLLVYRVALLCF